MYVYIYLYIYICIVLFKIIFHLYYNHLLTKIRILTCSNIKLKLLIFFLRIMFIKYENYYF